MLRDLHYGAGGKLVLDFDPAALVDWFEPAVSSLDSPHQATLAALQQPVDYPPLRQCVVPGDRVTIALVPGAVAEDQVLAAVLVELAAQGVATSDVTVLTVVGARDPRPALGGEQPELVQHAPQTPGELAYLAATETDQALYLNRRLVDADAVVVVAPGGKQETGSVYPVFSDAASIALPDPAVARETAWLMGLPFTVLTLVGRSASLAAVVAGHPQAAVAEAQRRWSALWSLPAARLAQLVIGTIEGPETQSAELRLRRAANTAARLASPAGQIVLCTTMAQLAPGDVPRAECSPRRRGTSRAATATVPGDWGWDELLERHTIYLFSQLDPAQVEPWGLVPVASSEEVARLVSRAPTLRVVAGIDCALEPCSTADRAVRPKLPGPAEFSRRKPT